MIDSRAALLDLIATLSFRLGDFTLASGQKSDYYIDCRTTTLHAEGGRLAGLVLYDLIREHIPHAVAVGGLTMGADPLVSNTASASAWALADYVETTALAEELDDPLVFCRSKAPSPPSSTASSSARPRRPTAPAAASKASSIPALPSSSSTTSAPPAAPPSPPSKPPATPA
jgi:hypothetical protein